jgi:hypothetical protein
MSGTWASTLLATVRAVALLAQLLSQLDAEESLDHVDAVAARGRGRARSWLDPQTGNARSPNILKQVAIVRGNLHHR